MLGLHIGIDLGGTKIAGVLLDAQRREIARARQPTPQGDYQATLAAVGLVVAELETESAKVGWSSQAPIPVGVGSPGVRLPQTGLMTSCNSVCLNNQPLREDLARVLDRTVQLANDADCFALSEWHQQQASQTAEPGAHDALLFGVILGTGVGGGWVHQGQLLAGPNGLAGEWGHTPLPYFRQESGLLSAHFELELKLADRHCYCGRKNCIESFLSGPGLQQIHHELWQQQVTPELLAKAWLQPGNLHDKARDAQQAWQSLALYLDMLARALSQVVNILDPACIVLGGGLSNMAFLYDELPRQMVPYLFSRDVCATKILPPLGGADSGVLGAAALVGPS